VGLNNRKVTGLFTLALERQSKALAVSTERLSSGLRINKAADDAAGLAISSTLRSDTKVYAQALRNVNDVVSALSIADAALEELGTIVTRQQELATQAASRTYSLSQRRALASESDALTQEYNRILSSTSFNGIALFNDSTSEITAQAGYSDDITFATGDELDRSVGTGTYTSVQTAQLYSNNIGFAGVGTLLSGDFSGDGRADLFSLDYNTTLSYSFWSLQLGNGNGTFTTPSTTAGGNTSALGSTSVLGTSGDVDGDGDLDILLTNNSSSYQLLRNNGNGTFPSGGAISSFANATAAGGSFSSLVDINGDNKLDFVTDNTGSAISVILGNGDGTFRASITVTTGITAVTHATADYNSDGFMDIAVGSSSGTISLLFGNGDGTFANGVTSTLSATGVVRLTTGDVNRDGVADVVAHGSTNQLVQVLSANSDRTFSTINSFTSSSGLVDRFLSDVNSDGYLDYINGAGSRVDTYYGNGDGTFMSAITSSFTMGGTATAAKYALLDFNSDGVLDLAATSPSGTSGSAWLSTLRLQTRTTSTAAYLNIATVDGARSALTTLDGMLDQIALERGSTGAIQSRMKSVYTTLDVTRENYAAASARITDIDTASEVAELTRTKILQQTTAAILAQANQSTVTLAQLLT
jgi:flagellin